MTTVMRGDYRVEPGFGYILKDSGYVRISRDCSLILPAALYDEMDLASLDTLFFHHLRKERAMNTAASEQATAESSPPPVQVGDRVLYTLGEGDVATIDAAAPKAHHGRNPVGVGQSYPAVVTAAFGPTCANLHVTLDGAGPHADYWATSRGRGEQPGQWLPRA
jgi:hypothetical protein